MLENVVAYYRNEHVAAATAVVVVAIVVVVVIVVIIIRIKYKKTQSGKSKKEKWNQEDISYARKMKSYELVGKSNRERNAVDGRMGSLCRHVILLRCMTNGNVIFFERTNEQQSSCE